MPSLNMFSFSFLENIISLQLYCYQYGIKIKLRSFKSNEHINEKVDGPYRGFGYLSLFSDLLNLAKLEPMRAL